MLRPLSLPASIGLPVVNRRQSLLLAVLLLAGMSQAVNMLHFPFYDNAEGINMANAWSVLHEGSLSPYTYNYDNPPLGWIFLALWLAVNTPIPASETVLALGRGFMLVVHILTALMIYGVARKFDLRRPFALLVLLLFCLSPLVTILQRRILVENLMTLWLLVALYCVLGNRRTLLHYAASAGALGMAFLTHVAAMFFFPAIFYVVLKQSHQAHRRFVLALWPGIAVSLFLAFPLQAALKDELLPAGVFFNDSHPHVSLYDEQSVQLERVSVQEFLRRDSSFIFNLHRWTRLDEDTSDGGFILAGFFCAALVLAMAIFWRPHLRPLALLLLLYTLHLATLKRLFDPAIIPLLPLLAISMGIAAQTAVHLCREYIPQGAARYSLYVALALLLVTVFSWSATRKLEIYSADQTSTQFDAVRWVSQHATPDSLVVTDSYAFVDLRQVLPDTHYYWILDVDAQARSELFDNTWCSISYMITTPQLLADMDNNQLKLLATAHRNSTTIQMYENDGWPIDVREVNKRNCRIPFP